MILNLRMKSIQRGAVYQQKQLFEHHRAQHT